MLLPIDELHRQGLIATATAAASVLLALAANATMKSVIAATGGTRQFTVRVVAAFVCVFGAGAAAWLVQAALLFWP
jgi:uncharacterized membrane protein (DUF4010 family)